MFRYSVSIPVEAYSFRVFFLKVHVQQGMNPSLPGSFPVLPHVSFKTVNVNAGPFIKPGKKTKASYGGPAPRLGAAG